MTNTKAIHWRILLASPPEKVFDFLDSQEGREAFWAESAPEVKGRIVLRFFSGVSCNAKILAIEPPARFRFTYFSGSEVDIQLTADGKGGTELMLSESACPEHVWQENYAGWVAWLLMLKAAVDHGIDLRNRDAARPWTELFVDG